MGGRLNYRGFALRDGVIAFYTFPMLRAWSMHRHLMKSLALICARELTVGAHLEDELVTSWWAVGFRLMKLSWVRRCCILHWWLLSRGGNLQDSSVASEQDCIES